MNKRKGISLIVLVITILVMIILAGVVVVSLQKNNPIEKAKEATFKQSLAQIGEELEMFCVNEKAQNSEFNKESLLASKNSLIFNTKTEASGKNIYDIIPSLKDSKYKNQVEVIAGSLYYRTPDKKEIPWLRELGIYYTGIVTGTVIIEGDTLVGVSNDYVNTGTLIIPSTVKKIKQGAFANCEDINAIVFQEPTDGSEGITAIPDNCFRGCTNLTSVKLPNTVKVIGAFAFAECKNLNEIIIPRDTEEIGYSSFFQCSKLQNIVFNTKLKKLGEYSFIHCGSLKQLNLNEGLEVINRQSFQGSAIQKVVIPDSVTYIGYGVFLDCRNLTSVHIGKNAKTIGSTVIRQSYLVNDFVVDPQNPYYVTEGNILYDKNKTKIICMAAGTTNVNIPSTVTEIVDEAFIGSKNIETLVIPEGVRKIGTRAFAFCEKLVNLSIPSSVTSIGTRVVEENHILTNLTIHPNNPNYVAENGVIFNKDKTELISAADVNKNYVVPSTVKVIKNCAFYQAHNLKSITLPQGLNKIEDDAFSVCGISEITIPGTVKSIGVNVFRHTTSLKNIVLEEGITSVNKFLVAGIPECTISIPSTVNSIQPSTFAISGDRIKVIFPNGNSNFKLNGNYITNADGTHLICGFSLGKKAVIPDGIKTIGDEAFREMNTTTEYIFPNTLTAIPYRLFSYNSIVKRVVIPSSVTSINDAAFKDTPNLSEIIIKQEEGSIAGSPWGATQGIKAVIWQ